MLKKLEPFHLFNYLPYKVEFVWGSNENTLFTGLITMVNIEQVCKNIRPKLRNLKKLYYDKNTMIELLKIAEPNAKIIDCVEKECKYPNLVFECEEGKYCFVFNTDDKYFVYWDYDKETFAPVENYLNLYELLKQKHYDVFDLIENKLAIEIC